jgi:photosystem II stability/assembly factor-like uncharacterized protein
MRGVRHVPARYFTLFLLVLMATLLLCAAAANGPWWIVQSSGIDANLRGVAVAEYQETGRAPVPVVWASGSNGVILQSKDEGKTWKQLHIAGGEKLDFRGIQAFDARRAYVMSSGEGENSRIYETTDGGANWKLEYTGQRKEIFLDALSCDDSSAECLALSDPVDGKFLLLATTDGEHWKESPRDGMPAALPNEGAFAASGTCLVFGGSRITFVTGGPAARVFRSSDHGASWTVSETPIAHGNASSGIFSIALHGDEGVAVGGDYKDPNRPDRVTAYSRDGGKTWTLAAQQPGGYRSAVAWVDGTTLVAAGPNGEDISEDGGAHWKHTDSLNLNALAILDIWHGWAVGPNGTVAHMENREEYQIRNKSEPDGREVAFAAGKSAAKSNAKD